MQADAEHAVEEFTVAMKALKGAVGDATANKQYDEKVLPLLESIAASMVVSLTGRAELLAASATTYGNRDTNAAAVFC